MAKKPLVLLIAPSHNDLKMLSPDGVDVMMHLPVGKLLIVGNAYSTSSFDCAAGGIASSSRYKTCTVFPTNDDFEQEPVKILQPLSNAIVNEFQTNAPGFKKNGKLYMMSFVLFKFSIEVSRLSPSTAMVISRQKIAHQDKKIAVVVVLPICRPVKTMTYLCL